MLTSRTVKNNLNPRDLKVYGEDGQWHYARLIVRKRERLLGKYNKKITFYLYLVYRNGNKIKEHYIARLNNKET